ncbi:hypothetical protein [Flectobacillus roseus]|uniref:hypothetical protein n=1 Tax=Flectobacillus roseus TaxID=502259 RepID=UPI0024B65554|nr:hypothetical protein [Flectobacillus roseus]MDI9870574.1 hypothetical protein [Flectobacillus roseus]
MKKIKVHRNIPQLRAQLVDANIEVDLWGRRTGKSVRIAHWLKRRSKQMPRCNLTFLTTNYNHLKKKILPEIKLAWEQMNWFENVHYWVGKYPPKELEIKLPYRLPPPKDAIFTIYGTVIKLASMDKNAPSAGDATDGLVVDECRLIDGKRLQVEIIPTVSGTNPKWQGKYFHCSFLFVSDKPRDAKGRWLYDYRSQVNEADVQKILSIQTLCQKLLGERDGGVTKKRSQEIDEILKRSDILLNKLRLNLVYVSEASTMSNVEVLGTKAIINIRKNTTKRNFNISVRNKDGEEVEDNFYEDINEDEHSYLAINYDILNANAVLQTKFSNFNSLDFSSFKNTLHYRCFSDIDPTLPLDMAIDWNLAGCSCSVRQMNKKNKEWKVIAFFFVLAPETHIELLKKVCEFFKPHPTRKVNFIYNHTFTAGKKHNLPWIAGECMQVIKNNGFSVKDCYLGQAWQHKMIRHWFKHLVKGQTPYKMTMNRDTTGVLYRSMKNTKTDYSESQGLKKNKRPEGNIRIPYYDAPHPSESFDQFIQYDFQNEEIQTPSDSYQLHT